MTKKSLYKMPLIAAGIVVLFGLFPPGIQTAKWVLETSPVIFYAVLVTAASAFGAWAYKVMAK